MTFVPAYQVRVQGTTYPTYFFRNYWLGYIECVRCRSLAYVKATAQGRLETVWYECECEYGTRTRMSSASTSTVCRVVCSLASLVLLIIYCRLRTVTMMMLCVCVNEYGARTSTRTRTFNVCVCARAMMNEELYPCICRRGAR